MLHACSAAHVQAQRLSSSSVGIKSSGSADSMMFPSVSARSGGGNSQLRHDFHKYLLMMP